MELTRPIKSIETLINEYHESQQQKPRYHFGLSMAGHHCERWMWLSFRWAVVEKFDGRMLRLFRRGHNEESILNEDLKSIGMEIQYTGYNQYTVDFGCHVKGHLDGIIMYGVPEDPLKRHVLEEKTHNKKSFDDLVKNGVEESKPMHYAQMQVYMHGSKIDRALYVAVCKDDDRLHTERVKYKKSVATKLVDKCKRIAMSEAPPPPISDKSDWYQCKMCAAHDLCHGSKLTKEVNCRTCAHSTPKEDSTFFCERYQKTIPNEKQQTVYPCHVLHPDLVPWDYVEAHDRWHVNYIIDGEKVLNGKEGFKSTEIVANPKACAVNNEFTQKLRNEFDARVTG